MKVWSFGEGVTSSDLNGNFAMMNALTPIGSVLYFDDLNGVNTINSNYWVAIKGQTISDEDSVYNGVTLPDLSGRYIVGYGNDAGGNIDSATWSYSPVGNAGHTVNISHTHDNHVHKVAYVESLNRNTRLYTGTYGGTTYRDIDKTNYGITGGSVAIFPTAFSDNGISLGDHFVSSAPNASDYSGSTSQTIQPRSIRFRAYLRFK